MMFFGFFWFLILIGIIAVVAYSIQSGGKGKDIFQNLGGQKADALEILRIRYAKGEVTKAEFEKMQKDLRG